MKAKRLFLTACCFLAAGLMFAQAQEGQERLLEIAKNETLLYFRRYQAEAEISGNKVIAQAQYGKYPVTIEITVNGERDFDIDIRSTVKESYIQKWKANLRKNIQLKL
jgi:uncharacterized protein (UPF0303 family)